MLAFYLNCHCFATVEIKTNSGFWHLLAFYLNCPCCTTVQCVKSKLVRDFTWTVAILRQFVEENKLIQDLEYYPLWVERVCLVGVTQAECTLSLTLPPPWVTQAECSLSLTLPSPTLPILPVNCEVNCEYTNDVWNILVRGIKGVATEQSVLESGS